MIKMSHSGLTHRGRYKMADFWQMTLSNALSSMKIFEIWLKFHWNNKPTLIQIMAWRRTGDKPLSEPKLAYFTDGYIYIYASMSKQWCDLSTLTLYVISFALRFMVSNEKRVRRALTYINGSSLQRYFSQRVLSIMIQHLFRLWFWWNNDGILLTILLTNSNPQCLTWCGKYIHHPL